ELQERTGAAKKEAEALSRQLADERAKTEQLEQRVADTERQLIAATTESEILARRVQEISTRLDEQTRFLADREFVSDRLRNEASGAQQVEAAVRAELADAEHRHRMGT